MPTRKAHKRGITLLELMVTLSIAIIIGAIAFATTGTLLRRNQLINQLKWVKSSVIRARAAAIENTAPVSFTLTKSSNRVLVVRDIDRTGDFSNLALVMGESLTPLVGLESPYNKVEAIAPSAASLPALAHWTGLSSQGNVAEFADDQFMIIPDGSVYAGDPLQRNSGTFYFKTNDDDFYGAVHITAMGEVKMATLNTGGDSDAWTWIE